MTASHGDAETLAIRLREATRAAHQRLDHHPVLAPLVKPTLTREAYARALAALHGPLSWLENMPSPPAYAPPASLSHRSPWLQQDLAAMGYAPWPFQAPPVEGTPESRVAVHYLLEGSSMGAAVIHRCLVRTEIPWPMAYFSVENPAERWQTLWQWVAQLPALNMDETCRAANELFDLLWRHMEDCREIALLPTSSAGGSQGAEPSMPIPDISYQ